MTNIQCVFSGFKHRTVSWWERFPHYPPRHQEGNGKKEGVRLYFCGVLCGGGKGKQDEGKGKKHSEQGLQEIDVFSLLRSPCSSLLW